VAKLDEQEERASRAFSEEELAVLGPVKIMGVRAGIDHRYTGVWPKLPQPERRCDAAASSVY
jgi:hypothetical protein